MSTNSSSLWDKATIFCGVLAFSLPLTLLIPNFSVFQVFPKFRVTRFHLFGQQLTWNELNIHIIAILFILFCCYLEIKKRQLDDLVHEVIAVSQATDQAMEHEKIRQTATIRACIDMLDSNTEHYEQLMLLAQDLRQRNAPQHPPVCEIPSEDL